MHNDAEAQEIHGTVVSSGPFAEPAAEDRAELSEAADHDVVIDPDDQSGRAGEADDVTDPGDPAAPADRWDDDEAIDPDAVIIDETPARDETSPPSAVAGFARTPVAADDAAVADADAGARNAAVADADATGAGTTPEADARPGTTAGTPGTAAGTPGTAAGTPRTAAGTPRTAAGTPRRPPTPRPRRRPARPGDPRGRPSGPAEGRRRAGHERPLGRNGAAARAVVGHPVLVRRRPPRVSRGRGRAREPGDRDAGGQRPGTRARPARRVGSRRRGHRGPAQCPAELPRSPRPSGGAVGSAPQRRHRAGRRRMRADPADAAAALRPPVPDHPAGLPPRLQPGRVGPWRSPGGQKPRGRPGRGSGGA